MNLVPVSRASNLDAEGFKRQFLQPEQPAIITDLMKDWPAKEKWTLPFFKKKYGHLQVPVYPANSVRSGKKYMSPDRLMRLSEYIDHIQRGDSGLRIFLFNILKAAPELQNDYQIPTILDGFYRGFPFTFFGGAGARTPMHYDIDMSHVFLNQFEGSKKVILFSPNQSKLLYKQPFTVSSHIDVDKPDYDKYPAMKHLKGYICTLNPGETLFMPSGYWHDIVYLNPGFSMSLRSNQFITRKVKGAINIATHYVVDKGMNRLLGKKWKKIKEDVAETRANRAMQFV